LNGEISVFDAVKFDRLTRARREPRQFRVMDHLIVSMTDPGRGDSDF
jgi:hypothetical protein